ncbi:Uncharacterised protein [Mycobacteroides abscessus]|nr:Uncharacterised protein [Mycobacteroides abscessus]
MPRVTRWSGVRSPWKTSRTTTSNDASASPSTACRASWGRSRSRGERGRSNQARTSSRRRASRSTPSCIEPGRVCSTQRGRLHPAAPRCSARTGPGCSSSTTAAICCMYSNASIPGSSRSRYELGTPLT